MNGELLFIIIILDGGIPRNVKSSSLHKKAPTSTMTLVLCALFRENKFLVVIKRDLDGVASLILSGEERIGERIFDLILDGAP